MMSLDELRREYEADLALYDRLPKVAGPRPLVEPTVTPVLGSATTDSLTDEERADVELVLDRQDRLDIELLSLHETLPKKVRPLSLLSPGVDVGFGVVGEWAQRKRLHVLREVATQLQAIRAGWTSAQRARAHALLVERGRRDATPGFDRLQSMSPVVAARFQQRASMEQSYGDSDDFSDVLGGQVRDWEFLLRSVFLTRFDEVAGVVLTSSRPDVRAILEEHFGSGRPHTLFVLHLWLAGLRRGVAKQNPVALDWIRSLFRPTVQRHQGEVLRTRDAFVRRRRQGVHCFIDEFRIRYRNRLAHGWGGGITAAEHAEWCDFAYGTEGLALWLDTGTTPLLHSPQHFGWLSFLTFAVRGEVSAKGISS